MVKIKKPALRYIAVLVKLFFLLYKPYSETHIYVLIGKHFLPSIFIHISFPFPVFCMYGVEVRPWHQGLETTAAVSIVEVPTETPELTQ